MSWTDYSQNVRIRDLEEGLSVAHSQLASERRRLRSELGRVRGSLEERLDRVSATLDAFIELSDVRATLAMFDNAALARHRTLQMLDGAVLPDLDLKDVPGYWLVPAARGLHALLDDDLSHARVRFDEAAGLDRERARCFAALAAPLTRARHARTLGESVSADMLPHLPDPGTSLNRAQRALWLLTADGSFGDDAREHLLLSTLRFWSAEGVQVPPVTAWSGLPAPAPRRGRKAGPANGDRAKAAQAVGELRERVARVTALGSEDTPIEVLAPDQASSDFLTETLRLLVEEGSTEEAPLLARANSLRAVIENGGEAQAPPAWSDPVDSVGTLLRRDLTREDAPPHRRTFALALQWPAVLDSAESLTAKACEPVPEKTSLNFQGTTITLTDAGADRLQVQRARDQLSERHTSGNGYRGFTRGALFAAAALLVLSLLTMNGFLWLLTLAALGAAGIAHFSDKRMREENEVDLATVTQQLDHRVAKAVEDWQQTRTAAKEHAELARRECEEVRTLLNPSTTRG